MKKLGLLVALLFATAMIFAQAPDPKVLKIGFVDADPSAIAKKAAPFSDYAAKNLSAGGISSALIVVAKDVAEMGALLKAGKVDLYIDTVYPVLEVGKITPVDLTWRRWKKGVAEYHTLFLAKKTSTLTDLKGLAGLKVGFEDSSSTSGRWLPYLMLGDMGYKLNDLTVNSTVPSGQIGYLYTGSADNTPVWIMQGKIDVGVMSNNDYDEMQAGLKGNLKTIAVTTALPRQLVVARSDLPASLKAALKTFFAGLEKSPDGLEMLKAWEKTAKVDEVTPAILQSIKQFEARLK